MIILHRYSNGDEVPIPSDVEPLIDEPAPGTVIVFIQGLAIQVKETSQEIVALLKKEKSK